MCEFSASAERQRDARQNEDLVVSRAPHGGSNWITEPGKPDIAVCCRDTTVLAIQTPSGKTRGAKFVHKLRPMIGAYDFVQYQDDGKELVPLNDLPLGTGIRVLLVISSEGQAMPTVPETIPSTRQEPADNGTEGELVAVGASSRRSRRALGFIGRLRD
jgi:hypothetical protein